MKVQFQCNLPKLIDEKRKSGLTTKTTPAKIQMVANTLDK